MASEVIGKLAMNMTAIKSAIKPWTDKEGKVRYYINDLSWVISDYRRATGRELSSYYDFGEMRASGGRVRQIIESNIIPKTKAFVDEEGHVHIYGWAIAGTGEQMDLPDLIERAINHIYGFCSEEERQERIKFIGEVASDSKIGDTVEIVKGRKEVGKIFVIAKITKYSYSEYQDPSIYLWDAEGFKVSAHNCKIKDVGYSY